MIKINLLGDALAQAVGKKGERSDAVQVYAESEGQARSSLPVAGVLVGLLFASLGGVYYVYLNNELERATQTKVDLERQKAELDKYIQLEEKFRKLKEARQKKEEVMLGLRKNQLHTVQWMQELANATPDDVAFREIVQKGSNFQIKGEGQTFESVQRFRNQLIERSKWFKNVSYPIGSPGFSKSKVSEFVMSFDLVNPV